jgi:hypothetical protein
MADLEAGGTAEPIAGRRTSNGFAAGTIGGVAALLSVGFLPKMFSGVTVYDDEGFFLATVRQFDRYGHLYTDIRTAYGPFYYTVMGALTRVIPSAPSPFVGRLTVLIFTALSASLFAAAVFRVTRSLAFSVLGEIVTFGVLISTAGSEPMHPGSLIVLVLSVLVFGLASYAMQPRNAYLVIIGASLGALLFTKINVGLFATTAVVVVFLVGNPRFPPLLGALAALGGALVPFLVMVQLLEKTAFVAFALLVSLSLVLLYVTMYVDVVPLPRQHLVVIGFAAVGAGIVSCLWPLLSGTSPTELVRGIVLRPLRLPDLQSLANPVGIAWLPFVVTLATLLAMFMRRSLQERSPFGPSWLPTAALGIAGILVLGMGAIQPLSHFLNWLPAIVLLPAFAWMSYAPEPQRLALRFLVAVAILQILHAYPIPGSQLLWGLVVMGVPCAIAIGMAAQQVTIWRQAAPAVQVFTITALGLVFLVGSGLSPVADWDNYTRLTSLGLPGTDLMRLEPAQVQTIRDLTAAVRENCDTFYAAPGYDSLYLYTGLPAPTGKLANLPGGLKTDEQQVLARELADLVAKGTRVCVLRDQSRTVDWSDAYADGPIVPALAAFQTTVAQVGPWTILHHGLPGAPS